MTELIEVAQGAIITAAILTFIWVSGVMITNDSMWWRKRTKPASEPRTPIDELVDVVIDVICNKTDEWVISRHNWTHEGLKFSIWIANGENHVSLTTDGRPAFPNDSEDHRNNVHLTKAQQKRLWTAIQNPRGHTTDEQMRRIAEEAIERVITHYSVTPAPVAPVAPVAPQPALPQPLTIDQVNQLVDAKLKEHVTWQN